MADFARKPGLRPVLATGARIARTAGTCSACGKPIRPGDREAELPADGGLVHVMCLARRPA